jgi:AcrR family transcriptional regulator
MQLVFRGGFVARSTGTASTERDDAPAGAPAPASVPCGARPLRADALRNRNALLAAAREAFTERGAEASLEDIARRAGVGVGTLYRHFPTRQDLIEAVYVDEVETLCRSAGDGGGTSWDALVRWFDRFVDYVATKRALVDEMVATIGQDAPVFRTCHDAIFSAGEPLLARAQADGLVRPDVTFHDAIRIVGGVSMIRHSTPEEIRRVLALALDGLRFRGCATLNRRRRREPSLPPPSCRADYRFAITRPGRCRCCRRSGRWPGWP